ncbi:hypothetical protein DPMN_056739 [Dreissena polymorpha]|uniref:Neurotransmitter-gated ion-channel ligand-binding domain-containing protein n=1 Tax=Dreissena polymorpha TaxID=45954 RepID=A0A9D4CUY3_DREPO|nr:hypothetical protein DPMN_056739 [Dreissena polymorpha]
MAKAVLVSFTLITVILGVVPIMGYSIYNVTLLRKTLFVKNEYDKIARPMRDQSNTTSVHVSLNIFVIYDIDEVTQTLKVSGSLLLNWVDENLMWEPDDFGGITTGVFPQEYVWKPGIALKNTVDDFKTLGDSR